MECILLRHGVALDRQDWKGDEALRPLTTEGRRKTRKALAGLRRLGVGPTRIFSSPLARALQTAQLAREILGIGEEIQIRQELLSDAPPEELLGVIASLTDDTCAILVGHKPHLGAAASIMLCGKVAGGLSLKKAGACSISFDGTPRAGRGTLNWWLTPAQLRTLAPR